MQPLVIIDAWSEPAGEVLLVRSRLFPGRVAVLLSAPRDGRGIVRRTCVRLGADIEVTERGVLAARLHHLLRHRRRQRQQAKEWGHDPAG